MTAPCVLLLKNESVQSFKSCLPVKCSTTPKRLLADGRHTTQSSIAVCTQPEFSSRLELEAVQHSTLEGADKAIIIYKERRHETQQQPGTRCYCTDHI